MTIYLIINDLSYNIQSSWIKLRKIIVGLIFIYKGNLFSIKIIIYYQIMSIIKKTYNTNKV